MNVIDIMKKRCSVRKYETEPVGRELLEDVLEAARIAPSACNNQPWHFIVVTDQTLKEQIDPRWGKAAPALILCCGEPGKAWVRGDGKNHTDIDVAIAVDHMTLKAAELGLGTCWVCSFDVDAAAAAVDLPGQLTPIVLLPIGYPAEAKKPDRHDESRKSLDDIVTWKLQRGFR